MCVCRCVALNETSLYTLRKHETALNYARRIPIEISTLKKEKKTNKSKFCYLKTEIFVYKRCTLYNIETIIAVLTKRLKDFQGRL